MGQDDKCIYILPVPHFFSQNNGVGGHVTHALGIIHGLKRCGVHVEYIAHETNSALDLSQSQQNKVMLRSRSTFGRQVWNAKLTKKIHGLVDKCDPKFCYIRYSAGFAPWIPIVKKILGDIPLVLEVNSFLSQRYRWGKFIDRLAIRSADLMISVSTKNKHELLQVIGEHFAIHSIVLPNGVDLSRFSSTVETSCSCTQKGFNIGYLGVLKERYGLEVMLDAARIIVHQYPEVVFNIYGEGPYSEALQRRAVRQKNVVFHGPIPFDQVPPLYRSFDVCINTAHPETFQNSPIKLFEYMASSKPIIHADTPQAREVLGNDKCGLLFKWDDPDDLVNKIISLIEDPKFASQLAYNARQEALRHHSWDCRVNVLLQVLKERGLLVTK
ncbi:glycosyltransferase family 4 protein [Desulfoluna butyratoxydans]|uniref:Glycosyl transferases group 1 n=1 Tax=Desulfoluna butyratoxydans TaxID=231438 RepID=A0A4U8YZT2_9BACT|nr:glycosyltransferase family 4 protein [Desulfoluna butyratoxydans]VFQ47463.1 glycosyl transferases group 1 [Desulfoluna butyratoxydans]